jgi:MYXO-CTERM domain-containing protein
MELRWRTLVLTSAMMLASLAVASTAHAEVAPEWNCTGDDDCIDPDGPYCDPLMNVCVQCLESEHCEQDFLCHAGSCIPKCFDDSDCSEPQSLCNPNGLCVECFDDAHCSSDLPVCILELGACRQCAVDEDCPDWWLPVCVPGIYRCEQCMDDSDCLEEEHCSSRQCKPDVCEPGELSCSEHVEAVTMCNPRGSGFLIEEHCEGRFCVNAACQDQDPNLPPSLPGEDGNADDDGQLSRQGCACSHDGGYAGSPWLLLFLLLGAQRVRRR